jgi:hypothetical protein
LEVTVEYLPVLEPTQHIVFREAVAALADILVLVAMVEAAN